MKQQKVRHIKSVSISGISWHSFKVLTTLKYFCNIWFCYKEFCIKLVDFVKNSSVVYLPAMEEDAISKVHYTSYDYRSDSNFVIVIYNITLPANIVHDVVQRRVNLERANELLIHDFGQNADIYFQVTGSYTLVNERTGATQLWTGSFYASHLNNPSQIQGFQKFDQETFVDSTFHLLNSAEQILKANGNDSEWTFESLTSII